MMVEREVERAIAGADADRNRVVRVALGVRVVAEFERGPRAARQLTAREHDMTRGVPEGHVLITLVGDDSVLLKRLSIQVAAIRNDRHARAGQLAFGFLAQVDAAVTGAARDRWDTGGATSSNA